ncbi:MAG: DUF4397 domain-containing protein [Pseudomonadota bacterium]|nr:DUF4397 domain-containing protein [Pseudomonadota bacterium]
MRCQDTRIKSGYARALVGLVWVGLLAACGQVADVSKAHVRLVNASPAYPQLDLYVDNELRSSAVGYGVDSGTLDIAPGKAASELRRSGETGTVISFTPSLSRDKDYTLLAYGREGALQTVLLDENNSEPDTGKARLRVINAAPDAGPVDVFVTTPGQRITDASPLQANAAVGTLGSFVTVDSGTRQLRVTATGSRTDVRLDIPNLVLSSKQVATIVIAPGPGGVLLQALVITERGAVARASGNLARVRAVAGVAANGSVSATVAGSALLTGVASPEVGNYILVPAGDALPTVMVNSVGVSTPSQTLTAGADYTLLVWGPLNAAHVNWISDDNSLPADTTKARVRLVNGVADLSDALALKVNLTTIASGVGQGTASDYALVDPSTTAKLSVNASGGSTPAPPNVDQTFAAGSSYSFFVLGSAGSAVGELHKDR